MPSWGGSGNSRRSLAALAGYCRSTARSHLAALGVSVLVAERCLNHALGGLVAVYDQHDYLVERRKALQLWTDFLTCCESGREWLPGDNVVPIRQIR